MGENPGTKTSPFTPKTLDQDQKNISKKTLAAIFLFALLLRLIYLLQIYHNPTFNYPTLDAAYHDEWAQAVAQGKLTQPQAFFRAPLYPYFLGLIYFIFGHNYLVPRILQHLIGSLSVVLLVVLTNRLFGKKIALTAGLVFAAYATVIYYEGELLLDSLLIPIDLLIFIFLYKAKDNPSFANWGLAGLCLGLSAITRPNILLFVPVVLIWLFWSFRKTESAKRRLYFAAVFIMGMVLPILPVAGHNYRAEKSLVLIASQGGVNFYIGNNPRSNGYSSIIPGRPGYNWKLSDVSEAARQETGQNLSSGRLSNFWYKKGLEFWYQNPAQALRLTLKKTSLFFSAIEISNDQDIYPFWKNSWLIRALPVGFWIIGPLGFLGIIFTFTNRKARLLSLFVLVYSLSVIAFFVNARFRLPILPFMALFAVYALFELWKKIREKKNLLLCAPGLVVLFILVNANWCHLQKTGGPQGYFRLGNVFLEKGNFSEARRYYEVALEIDPHFRFAHLNLGTLALKRGDLKTAEKEYLAELSVDPLSERALSNLSLVNRLAGQPRPALYWAEKSAASKPYFQEAYLNQAWAYGALGKPESALIVLQEGRKKCSRYLLGNFLTASFLVETKRYRPAEALLFQLLDSLSHYYPGFESEPFFTASREFEENLSDLKSRAFYLLGRSKGEQNNLPEAVRFFQKSLEENPQNIDAAANLGTALDRLGRPVDALFYFEKALAAKPDNFALYFNYGLALAKTGKLRQARQAFQKTLELNPGFAPAKEKLTLVELLLQKQQ